MRKGTLRLLFKVAAFLNLAFVALVAWDYFRNDSRLMVPLLITFGVFLLGMMLLFFARPQGPAPQPADQHPIDADGKRLVIAERP
ncbi:MAG: hypothetical protein ABR562_04860 [Thermoplasmatota archaeon]